MVCARRELKSPDLVLLDLMLPMVDGLEVCRRLRADPVTRNMLVLMLTAKTEETDEVVGFSVGTDDYVAKPFSVKVLLERIRALLRRREGSETDGNVLVSQGIMIDRERHRVTVEERPLDLTPSEFGLLEALIRQPGRVFSRVGADRLGIGGRFTGARANDRCAYPVAAKETGAARGAGGNGARNWLPVSRSGGRGDDGLGGGHVRAARAIAPPAFSPVIIGPVFSIPLPSRRV